MKNLLKQKLIKSINKILKLKNEKKLLNINRRNCDEWDSLNHLKIIFYLKKISKIKFQSIN